MDAIKPNAETWSDTTRFILAITSKYVCTLALPTDQSITVSSLPDQGVSETVFDLNEASKEDAQTSELPDLQRLTIEDAPRPSDEQIRDKVHAIQLEESVLEKEEHDEKQRRTERARWKADWLAAVCTHLNVKREALPDSPRLEELRPLLSSLPSNSQIHNEIVSDLVLVSLGLAGKAVDPKAPAQPDYTALARTLIFSIAATLDIPASVVYTSEKAIAQQLFFILREVTQAETDTTHATMDETSRKAIEKRKTSKAWKWAATGAGLVVGGVAIGLTGGLAAPVLAPLLVGASAGTLGFLATSGGAILLGTLFGVAGGGLTAFRARRRIQGIDEFEFHQIVDDPELPQIPSLHATIVCTGFMTKENDYIDPWRPTCNHTLDRRDVYALKTESAAFLSAGKDLDTYVRDYVLMKGATEVVKRTALAAFYTAVALPAAIYKSAGTVLDNQFIRTRDKANKAGILLADVLEQRVQGARPTTLIGAGLGAVIVFRALIELHSRGLAHLLFDVILISAPLSPSPAEWAKARHVVSRRLVNAYSSNDYVLAIVVRLHSLVSTQLTLRVAGLQPVGIDGVEDVNVSEIVGGHMELLSKLDQVLAVVDLNK